MNLTTGTGQIAWKPKRLSAEAYALDIGTVGETLPSPDRSLNVLEGVFPYGPVGVCRGGGTCVLSKVPAGWADSPYPRLMRFRLESEHGTGYVYSAVAKEVKKDGRRALVDFISVQDKYALRSLYTGGLLSYPGLVSSERVLGVNAPYGYGAHRIREEAWSDALAPYLNAEWGVGPDMVGTAGRPEGATPLDYTLDYRAGNPVSQGFVIPDYATEWIFDPGEEWAKTTGSRAAPPWTPERTISASADPATINVLSSGYWSYAGELPVGYVSRSGLLTDGTARAYNDPVGLIAPGGNEYGDSARYTASFAGHSMYGRNRKITISCPFMIVSASLKDPNGFPKSPGSITITVTAGSYSGSATTEISLNRVGLQLGANFEVPADFLVSGGQITINYLVQMRGSNLNSSVAFQQIQSSLETEVPNTSGIIIPREFMYPFFAGPPSQFNLTAWVAPPVRALNLPGGLTQFLAQSEVHWTSKGAMSVLTTAAMPWR